MSNIPFVLRFTKTIKLNKKVNSQYESTGFINSIYFLNIGEMSQVIST